MTALNPSSSTSDTSYVLSATYKSPTNEPFTHTQKLPAPQTASPADRVTYLSSLRKATTVLQDRINKELTERMEEDKAKASAQTNGKTNGVDEGKEEENYGEEVVEED